MSRPKAPGPMQDPRRLVSEIHDAFARERARLEEEHRRVMAQIQQDGEAASQILVLVRSLIAMSRAQQPTPQGTPDSLTHQVLVNAQQMADAAKRLAVPATRAEAWAALDRLTQESLRLAAASKIEAQKNLEVATRNLQQSTRVLEAATGHQDTRERPPECPVEDPPFAARTIRGYYPPHVIPMVDVINASSARQARRWQRERCGYPPQALSRLQQARQRLTGRAQVLIGPWAPPSPETHGNAP